MNKRDRFIKNIINVMLANMISLLGGIAGGFLLPKLFSLEDYGFFKIFSLYLTYTGILHMGFPDGFLLKNSGVSYVNLEKANMRTISHFFIVFQLIVSFIIIVGSFFAEGEYGYIFFSLGLCTFSINIITFFQFVSQASMRFNEFSRVKIATSLMNFGIVVGLCIVQAASGRIVGYRLYLMLYTFANWCILLYYFWNYRECLWGKKSSLASVKGQIWEYFKSGIFLTISYQVLQLVLNLDRQFVVVLFSAPEYAVYSFAYSLISMITTVVSAVSLVLFPTLKRTKREIAITFLPMGIWGVESLVMLCLGSYFPLAGVIETFLPKYMQSLSYLQILFPGWIFSSCITIIIFTYYKILDFNLPFFLMGIGALILSFLLNLLAWKMYGTPEAISFASILTLLVWYIITVSYLKKKLDITYKKNLIFMLCVSICFYIVVFNTKVLVKGFLVYEAAFILITIVFYKEDIKKLFYGSLGKRRG